MKRMTLKRYAIILASVMLLGGCAESAPADTTTATTAQTEAVQKEAKAIADIYDEITNNVTLYSPFCWDDEFISNYYGIDTTSLEESKRRYKYFQFK